MPALTLSNDLKHRIREIVADVLEIGAEELTESSGFEETYNADSIVVIEILARFERHLGVVVRQDEVEGLTNLGAAYEIVARKLADRA
ncbi:acyl carrier protein [Kitasatospora sp. NPDC057223]|uniref:acyl carrier protein n=1 Tax=Kitasatospora sp. NPDC057223 TaxID=3346055 RepID=UPI0036448D4C